MTSSWINQRLNDLENNIQRDLELLNDFEEELSYEKNPRIKAGYRKEIERQQESIAKYQQEYDDLKEKLKNDQESSTQVKKIGNQLDQMDSKLNLILSSQVTIYENLNQMQQKLLTRYNESEKFIVAEIAQKLDENQIKFSENLLEALENNQISQPDIEEMVAIIEQRIPTLPPSQQKSMNEIFKNPQLNGKHKLKVAIPIIPLVAKYEAELELGAGFDLKSSWEWIKNKLQRN